MSKNYKKILIIVGDPNSINSEIIYKSWKKIPRSIKKRLVFIGNFKLIQNQFKQLKYKIKLNKLRNFEFISKKNEMQILNVNLKFKNPFKVLKENASVYIKNCLNMGHKLSLKNNVAGLINCPINKNLFIKQNIGVTEFLANKCKIKNKSEVMMIKNKNFSVCPVTTHIDLKNVSKNIKAKTIIAKIKTIQKSYFKLYKKKPKIGILGLNPHNAEFKIGSEEKKEIIPAIIRLKKLGFKIYGPLVSDTIFIKDYKRYDVIVGMYHDQVLTPFKTIFKFEAINITLGLKYYRLSPDHGVAINLIKKNKANPASLLQCIKFLYKFK